jgi:hypothetical protein
MLAHVSKSSVRHCVCDAMLLIVQNAVRLYVCMIKRGGDYERLKPKPKQITRNSQQQPIHGTFLPINAIRNTESTRSRIARIERRYSLRYV